MLIRLKLAFNPISPKKGIINPQDFSMGYLAIRSRFCQGTSIMMSRKGFPKEMVVDNEEVKVFVQFLEMWSKIVEEMRSFDFSLCRMIA